MGTFTIDEVTKVRTALNIHNNDLILGQIKDGSSDNLKSFKMTKSELFKTMNSGALIYKALISQNAPIATTQTPTIVAGQIWEDTVGTADAGDLAILGAYELISGTLGAINAKYRSAANDTPVFVTTSFAYDGAPYIVSTDSSGNLNPFINTLGGEPMFSYSLNGDFRVTLVGVFIDKKTFVNITPSKFSAQYRCRRVSDDEVQIKTTDFTDVGIDNILLNTPFSIEVYP